MTYTTENKCWLQGDEGWYWVADLLEDGSKVGITGNYYILDERLEEKPEEEKECTSNSIPYYLNQAEIRQKTDHRQ